MSGEAPVIRIVDDDEAFRTAISRVVRAAGFEVREFASAGDYLLAQSEDEHGCLLLDLRMPGPSGLDLQRALSRKENSIPIVFLTAHGDISASVRAMKAGAADFLVKPVKRDTLLSAIRTALAKDEEQRGARTELIELRSRYNSLSSRERDVLRHVVAGRLNKQIAAAIGASERTVKAHRARVMSKMHATSVADLVRAADRLGAAPPEIPSST